MIRLWTIAGLLGLLAVPANGQVMQGIALPVCGYNTDVRVAGHAYQSTQGPKGSACAEESGHSYSHISTNTNTQVKIGVGMIHTLMLGKIGTSGEAATLYDNTACSGPVISVVDLAGQDAKSVIYDLLFNTGLCVTTGGGGAADITVTYR